MANGVNTRRRLNSELKNLGEDGFLAEGIYLARRSHDITAMEAFIIGPQGTPYDGGIFHFHIKCSSAYPLSPPEVSFKTTDGGTLCFHPQLYSNGHVCLSILGTWRGPPWTPQMTLRTVLLSIQSLLNDAPLRCEPGRESKSKEEVDKANVFCCHETLRVAILGFISGTPSWGDAADVQCLTVALRNHFSERCPTLLDCYNEYARKHDGQVSRDPFALVMPKSRGTYQFAALAEKLKQWCATAGKSTDAVAVVSQTLHANSAPEDLPRALGTCPGAYIQTPCVNSGASSSTNEQVADSVQDRLALPSAGGQNEILCEMKHVGVTLQNMSHDITRIADALERLAPAPISKFDPSAECRFCYRPARADEPLCRPCDCNDPVHLSCLQKWVDHHPIHNSTCAVCLQPFQDIQKSRCAEWLDYFGQSPNPEIRQHQSCCCICNVVLLLVVVLVLGLFSLTWGAWALLVIVLLIPSCLGCGYYKLLGLQPEPAELSQPLLSGASV